MFDYASSSDSSDSTASKKESDDSLVHAMTLLSQPDPDPWDELWRILREELKRLNEVEFFDEAKKERWQRHVQKLYTRCRNVMKQYEHAIKNGSQRAFHMAKNLILAIMRGIHSFLLIIIPCVPCLENEINGGAGGGQMMAYRNLLNNAYQAGGMASAGSALEQRMNQDFHSIYTDGYASSL